MYRLLTTKSIKFITNALILFVLIQGGSIIISQANTLLNHPEQIDILRLEIPWNHPMDPVTVMFDGNKLKQNPVLLQQLNEKLYVFDLIERAVFIPLIVLLLFQLKKLLVTIRQGQLFEIGNRILIRNLSVTVGVWVGANFILYQLLPLFINQDLLFECINYTTLSESVPRSLVNGLDFKMLFVAIVLWVISVLFRESYKLKEESELTI